MSFKLACRLFSSSLRPSARANLCAAARPRSAALTRRMMSSGPHGSSSSDTPWMVGSALVFGPLFLYLVSPSARKGHSDANHEHKIHHAEGEGEHVQHGESHREADVKPITEGTEVSGQEVKESMEKAFDADSPKDAQEQEETVAMSEPTATAVEVGSASEMHSPVEPLAGAVPAIEAEPNAVPSAIVADDVTADVTADEKTQKASESQPVTESKA